MKKILYCLTGIGMLAALTACDADLWEMKDDSKGAFVQTTMSPISSTLSEQECFDEWVKVLNYSECYPVLNALYESKKEVKFTHFAPNNEAMRKFYADKGVNGIEDLGKYYASALVQTMTYQGDSLKLTEKFTTSVVEFSLKSVANEQLLLTVDSENPGFLMRNVSGKEAIHVVRNYKACTNGFYYETDGVLTPLIETVYDIVARDSHSSIMAAVLKATGYDQELSTLADTVYNLGKRTINQRAYTFFNVSDETFHAAGIQSVADLKSALQNRASEAADADSLLKLYVQYHIMDKAYDQVKLQETHGVDTVRIWSTLAPNQIMMISKAVVSIQQIDSVTSDTTFASYLNTDDIKGQLINASASDVMAKNGYVHQVDGWLPLYEPKPMMVVWDLTDYADVRNAVLNDKKTFQPATYDKEEMVSVKELPCYEVELSPDGKGPNESPALAYATCKNNLKNCVNNDRLVINVGYMGYVAMTSPTLAKGKYRVSISVAYTTNHSDIKKQTNCKGGMMRVLVDGENEILSSPYTTITSTASKAYEADLYEEIEFTETRSHNFKFVVLDPAASTSSKFTLQFDAITFTPIE